jgi:DNA-directed RNA polymerase subunit RPC12/RpoP
MNSINKLTPSKSSKFDGILIGVEHTGPEKVEYVCSWCNRSLVRLSDRNNQSESWFCQNCSIEFDTNDEQISYKQKLSIPYEDSEPAIASIGSVPDVSIHHTPQLRGGFAALAKKGTIRFTSYNMTEKE